MVEDWCEDDGRIIVVRMKVRVVKIVGSIFIRMVVSNCRVAFVTEKNIPSNSILVQ